jgi:membrane-bound lytic murein transglycosylase D
MHIEKITFLFILFLLSNTILLGNSLTKNDTEGVPTKPSEVAYIDSNIVLDSFSVNPNEVFDDIFSEKFDSLANEWYIKNAFDIDSTAKLPANLGETLSESIFNPEFQVQNIPDSVFIQRLESLNSMIDLSYNASIKNMIEFYAKRIRNKVEIMLGLSNYYFPIFEQVLDKYQLPLELKYMAIIESALNAKAISRAGATGLWQFMYGTGKLYGLKVTSYVDERRDPLKATEAAARYLRDLYNLYGDWHLVIAAYNCGPGNINRAIARSGGKKDYWSIYYRLPRETRGYVPAFISAAYIMNYYKLHDLLPQVPSLQITSDTIMVSNFINLNQISSTLNLNIDLLRELNPMYKKDIIPAKIDQPFPLVLPVESITQFIESEKEIFAYNREIYFPNNKLKEPEKLAGKSGNIPYVPNIEGKTKVYYTVKTNEVIGMIAGWFKVKTIDIKYWNNIRGNLVRYGQQLAIYVPNDLAEYYSGFDAMSFNEKQHAIGKTTTQQIAINTDEQGDGNYVYHTVRSGDNLWDIARQYPGVSAEEIKTLNNITNTHGLYPGQKLKIMKKS